MNIALVSTAQRSGCPPIGLVYLASYIQNNTKHQVNIRDNILIKCYMMTK